MVTTRRRGAAGADAERDATPPAAVRRGGAAAATPRTGTPRTQTLPDGRTLKSALRAQSRYGSGDLDEDGYGGAYTGGGGATPAGAGIVKRVRIDSGQNMTRVFVASLQESGGGAVAAGGGDGGSVSPPRRRRGAGRGRGAARAGLAAAARLLAAVAGGGAGGGAAGPPPAWVGAAATLAWMAASTALIFVNKTILVDLGFDFPLALTALGQAASWAAARAARAAAAPARRTRGGGGGGGGAAPPLFHPEVLPIAACAAASLFLGNAAYLWLSVAHINVLKALTPAATYAAGVAAGTERWRWRAAGATAVIGWGASAATAAASAAGRGGAARGGVSAAGLAAFGGSLAAEAARVVLAERLLARSRRGRGWTPAELVERAGPPTLALLAAGAALLEAPRGLGGRGAAAAAAAPGRFAAAAALSLAVNLTSYAAIASTSGTAMKAAGCVRNVGVAALAALGGDRPSSRELRGFVLSLAGWQLLAAVRGPPRPRAAAPTARRLRA